MVNNDYIMISKGSISHLTYVSYYIYIYKAEIRFEIYLDSEELKLSKIQIRSINDKDLSTILE